MSKMSKTEQLLSLLDDTAKLLQRTEQNLKKCPKQRLTQGYVEIRLKSLEEHWVCFKSAHQELIKITTREQRVDMPYFANEDFFVYEDLYISLQADLRDLLLKSKQGTSEEHNVSVAKSDSKQLQVKLPKVTLPMFSGKYDEWITFHDLFKSLVHENNAISNVQKLHYLKTSITGEAQALLQHIHVTEANYLQAWETLKQRYGNQRVIITSILKRLFYQKKIFVASAPSIKLLLDTTTECLNSIKNLSVNIDSWDPLIVFMTVQKLDPESHRGWEECSYKQDSDVLPTWADLQKFLESKFRTLELVNSSSVMKEKYIKEKSFHIAAPEKKCVMCNDNHTLSHCKEFGKMSPEERCTYVTSNKLCYNCLLAGHSVYRCRVPLTCRICHKKHHSLLHVQQKDTTCETSHAAEMHDDEEQGEEPQTTIASHHSSQHSTALLATAMVTLRNDLGQRITVRALIDQGSQACFISEKATQLLKLKRIKTKGSVVGVGSTKTDINNVVKVEVLPRRETDASLHIQAYVISKQLTTKIPHHTIPINNWPHLKGLELADSSFHTPGSIDLLLGVREYVAILQPELIKGPLGSPCAQRTSLGWILFGEVDNSNNEENKILVMHHQVEIDDMLKVLWEIDTSTKRLLTKEEKRCEEIYTATHTRNKEGRYVVKLPFKTQDLQSPKGNTREIAMKRLTYLEKRFKRQPKLEEDYRKVMDEYLTMGHMELIPKEELTNESVYLPHHAVCREDKETTKTRVVFDPSCKGTNNVSLNEELLVGPVLQDDLRNIIMRWRLHAICFLSDIEKMYRMVLVSKEHIDFQRIVWRGKHSDEVQDYRLLTVTFGMASSPYLAIRTLMQLADDEEDAYPIAAKIIREDFYVDDVMTGCDTLEEALEAYRQLKGIMKQGGFELKKWSSNNVDFMTQLDKEERSAKAQIDLHVDGTIKALGITWDLYTDEFIYNFNLPSTPTITKRTIFSDIQKLFDPLGWMSPTVVLAKMMIQKLWLEKVGWDDTIKSELIEDWLKIRSDLENVNNIRIPRWLHTVSSNREYIQIHGFSDASIRAYAAVVYIRVEHMDGSNTVRLIAARTKVAPLKTVSLPRLELCGAHLLSQLLTQVAQAMRIPIDQVYAWTDSTIVLSWLMGESNRWKTFVANRVVQILEAINRNHWYHVESQDNPADIASRGMLLKDLKSCDMWWNGPKWLHNDKIELKTPKDICTDLESKNEKIISTNLNITDKTDSLLTDQFSNFTTLKELLKTISICTRFLNFRKVKEYPNSLTTEEINNSLNKCIKLVQQEEFTEEIETLTGKQQVKKHSILKSLNPYLDENNIIRVGGRLRNADMSNDSKHPIILGNKNNLTPLIIDDAHKNTLHGGIQLMMCYIRNKYWIIKAKVLIKAHVNKCLVCARLNARPKTQLMGDLPKERVTPSRPFLHTGVDFAGPLQVLWSRSRGAKTNKAYIAIFICLVTKAVHLELVGDMTSEAFIGAFRRFTARRGQCSHLYSDQGRNFVGADKELKDAWQEASLEFAGKISESLTMDGTQWHFIPAYSPNFGGLWEAGVKSIKFHLKRILNCNLTYEELTTLLCQIEACLNSRPLSPIDDTDIDNINPLTPGHFLIGEAPIVVPGPSYETKKITNLSRWQHIQKLLGDFWKKWQQEYLSRIQTRPKWIKQQPEFEKRQIVLIKSDNLPPGKWALGRIIDKHPGPDGLTRVYSVKSGNSVVKRPITKLCFLPIDDSD